jgi:hypothetical protein
MDIFSQDNLTGVKYLRELFDGRWFFFAQGLDYKGLLSGL